MHNIARAKIKEHGKSENYMFLNKRDIHAVKTSFGGENRRGIFLLRSKVNNGSPISMILHFQQKKNFVHDLTPTHAIRFEKFPPP